MHGSSSPSREPVSTAERKTHVKTSYVMAQDGSKAMETDEQMGETRWRDAREGSKALTAREKMRTEGDTLVLER